MKILFSSIQALLDCLSRNTNIKGYVFESKYGLLVVLPNKIKIMSLVHFELKVKTTSYLRPLSRLYRKISKG
jgi:hypothetical protein